ncbi:MAG: YHS domain-containing protein [Syntrophothermus sp.]
MLSFNFSARSVTAAGAAVLLAFSLNLNAQDKPADKKEKKEIKKEKVVKTVKEGEKKGCACCSGKEMKHEKMSMMKHGKVMKCSTEEKKEGMDCKKENMKEGMDCKMGAMKEGKDCKMGDNKEKMECKVEVTKDADGTVTEETTTSKDGKIEKKIIKKRIIKNDDAAELKDEKPWNAVCPVLGNKVDASVQTVTYNGKAYGFCCAGCDSKFKADPEKYSKNLSEDGKKFLK